MDSESKWQKDNILKILIFDFFLFKKDTSKKMRNERYYQIPLCKADCDSWFEDCQSDFTCRDNWNKGFVWKNSTVNGGTRKIILI